MGLCFSKRTVKASTFSIGNSEVDAALETNEVRLERSSVVAMSAGPNSVLLFKPEENVF